jgi:hypothetical protein
MRRDSTPRQLKNDTLFNHCIINITKNMKFLLLHICELGIFVHSPLNLFILCSTYADQGMDCKESSPFCGVTSSGAGLYIRTRLIFIAVSWLSFLRLVYMQSTADGHQVEATERDSVKLALVRRTALACCRWVTIWRLCKPFNITPLI